MNTKKDKKEEISDLGPFLIKLSYFIYTSHPHINNYRHHHIGIYI